MNKKESEKNTETERKGKRQRRCKIGNVEIKEQFYAEMLENLMKNQNHYNRLCGYSECDFSGGSSNLHRQHAQSSL